MLNRKEFIEDYLKLVKNKTVDESGLVSEAVNQMHQNGTVEYQISSNETISGKPELLYFRRDERLNEEFVYEVENTEENFAEMTIYKNYKTKGGNWSTIKHGLETKKVTREFYNNIVEHPWKEDRMTRSYTSKGYLVTKVVTTNPHTPERTVREFKF